MRYHRSLMIVYLALIGATLAGCAKPTLLSKPTESSPLVPLASPTLGLSPTQAPPTRLPSSPAATATLTPSMTPSPTRTPTPTQTLTLTHTASPTYTSVPESELKSGIVVYLIFTGEGAEGSCMGYTVPVPTGIYPSGDVKKDVAVALNYLFSIGVQYSGNLYNPLFRSRLTVSGVDFKKSSNDITVYLTGSFSKPKTDCDKRLYRAQVWDTIRQFPEVKRAHVWVGNLKLGDLLAVDY